MKDLIIMSCSRTKKNLENVPAMDLYDGQAYRVIKKSAPENVEILIISAKYGLIRSTDVISQYEQLMTVSRAVEIRKEVSEGITNIVSNENITRTFVSLGFPYNHAVSPDLMRFLDGTSNLQVADGPIGKRLHQLKEWLKPLKAEAMK